jgi:hypothetical protein
MKPGSLVSDLVRARDPGRRAEGTVSGVMEGSGATVRRRGTRTERARMRNGVAIGRSREQRRKNGGH